MAKQKKKRNKVYSGSNATASRPTITKVSAVNRSKVGQWWYDRKRIAKPIAIGVGIAIAVILMIIEVIRLVSGA